MAAQILRESQPLARKPHACSNCEGQIQRGRAVPPFRVAGRRRALRVAVCALTPHSRAEYAACWPITEDIDDLERARRVWVKLAQGRGGQLRPTGWRYHEQTHGRNSSMPRTLASYVGRFAAVAERLRSVSLECRPAHDVIDRYGRDTSTLLYVDPPYLMSTRSRTAYRHEMHSDQEHRDLADALADVKGIVVLSGYHSPLYDELYDGWHVAEISAFTGQANGGRAGGDRVEVLWSNRPLGAPSLLGHDLMEADA